MQTTQTPAFSIHGDLNGRPFVKQVEILWISGPHGSPRTHEEREAHIQRIAHQMLHVDERSVREALHFMGLL